MTDPSRDRGRRAGRVSSACVVLVAAVLGWSAPLRADFATDSYFTAKAEAQRSIERLRKAKGNDAADLKEQAALRDLAGKLATAIGPVAVDGFKPDGTSNVATLSSGDLGEGNVDGLLFAAVSGEEQLVVTTETLINRWLRVSRAGWDRAETAPRDMAGALQSDAFYTQVVGADAAVGTYALLPVAAPAGVTAQARLIDRRQEYVLSKPTELLVTVRKGERVSIALVKTATEIAMIPACEALWMAFEAKAKAGKISAEAEDKARMKVDTDFRRCFADRIKDQASFQPLLTQANGLVARMAK